MLEPLTSQRPVSSSPADFFGDKRIRRIRDGDCAVLVNCDNMDEDGYLCFAFGDPEGMTGHGACEQLGLSCRLGECDGDGSCAAELTNDNREACLCR